jgi:hypothetical protein
MLPDFDYGMHPTEIKQVVSYNEERAAARVAGGGSVTAAAQRIAAVPRVTANGAGNVTPIERRPAPAGSGAKSGAPIKARPQVKVADKSAKVASRANRSPRSARSAARPSRSARSIALPKKSPSGKKHKPAKAKGRK